MDDEWVHPVDKVAINSRFDPHRLHPVFKVIKPHEGADYKAATGTPVRAVHDGEVLRSTHDPKRAGQYLRVGVGGSTWVGYSHLSERHVPAGTRVRTGDVLGLAGSTGAATGPHLHFEVCVNGVKRDPVPFLHERTGEAIGALALHDEEDEMRDDERNMLFHLAALLEQTPLRTAQHVWAQQVSRVEGRPTTILQDTVDGTTSSMATHLEVIALAAAVQALSGERGLEPAEVTEAAREAAREGAREAMSRSPQVELDEEALALSLAPVLADLADQLPDDQIAALLAALTAEQDRRRR